MSTPDFVKFSRIPFSARDAMDALDESVFKRQRIRLTDVGRLEKIEGTYTGGLDLIGEVEPCSELDEAFERTREDVAVSLTFLAPEVRANLFFSLFDLAEDSCGLTLALDDSIPYHRSDDFESGEWLFGFLIACASALNVEACGYGNDNAYSVFHESLATDQVLTRLNQGELFKPTPPIFHAISQKLVSVQKVQNLLKKYRVAKHPKYTVSSGFHDFAYLP